MFDIEKFICEVEQRPPLYDLKAKAFRNKETKAMCWAEVASNMYKDWEEMSTKMKDTKVKALVKKWKTIRDSFVRDLKHIVLSNKTGQPAIKKKRYIYYDLLQFLIPHVKAIEGTPLNILPCKDEVDDSDVDQDLTGICDIQPRHIPIEIASSSTGISASTASGSVKRKEGSQQFRESKKTSIDQSVESSANYLTSILSESVTTNEEDQDADRFGNKAFLLSFVPILNALPLHEAMEARLHITQVINTIYARSRTYSGFSSEVVTHPASPSHLRTLLTDTSQEFTVSDSIDIV